MDPDIINTKICYGHMLAFAAILHASDTPLHVQGARCTRVKVRLGSCQNQICIFALSSQ